MDVVALMEALAEQDVTVLFKADAERMAERGKPWTFAASGTPLREGVRGRTDAASVEQCRAVCLPRPRELGFSFPERESGCDRTAALDVRGGCLYEPMETVHTAAALLPDPAELRAHLRALAVLDQAICREPRFARHSFSTAQGPGRRRP